MTEHVFRFLSSATVIAVVLGIGAAEAADDPRPQSGGTMVSVLTGDPTKTNPVMTNLEGDQFVGCLIYDGLVNVRPDGGIRPALSREWTISSDNLSYTFKLNATTWHDGTAFTSQDVKFSIENLNTNYSSLFSTGGRLIAAIETPSSSEVVIRLSQPYGPFLRSLACQNGGGILPAHIFQGKGDPLTNPASLTKPIGTGPFRLAEWKRGDFMRFTKNEQYWDKGKPYLDEIITKIIPQATSRSQALRTGEVDFVSATMLPNSDTDVLRATPTLKLTPGAFPPTQSMLFLNSLNPILANKDVRKALMVATNRDYIVKNVFNNAAAVARGPFPAKIEWAFNEAADYTKLYAFDAEKANSELDRAGVKRQANGDRFELSLFYDAQNSDAGRVVQAVQSMWRDVGVKVNIQGLDRPTVTQRVFAERKFDMLYWSYTSYGDPAVGLTRIYASSAVGKPFGNPSGYANPEVDRYFERGASEVALPARGAEYKKAAAIIADDLPVIVLSTPIPQDVSTKKLHGVWEFEGYGSLAGAWLEH